MILSLHPERCGDCLTPENGWTVDPGKTDEQTKNWAINAGDARQDLALKGVVGPAEEGFEAGQLPEGIAARSWFLRSLVVAGPAV